MQIAILVVLAGIALLAAPMLLSAAVAILAIVLWKSGKTRLALQVVYVVAALVLTYWLVTTTALLLAAYDAYVWTIAVGGALVVASGVFGVGFRAVFMAKKHRQTS